MRNEMMNYVVTRGRTAIGPYKLLTTALCILQYIRGRSFAEGVFCVAFVLCAINGGADIINFICSARLSSGSIGTHEVINTRTPAGAGRRLK